MSYGIGRVPQDVDPITEALAELEAERLQPTRPASPPTGHCARCGAGANWVSGAGEYLCYRHEDDY